MTEGAGSDSAADDPDRFELTDDFLTIGRTFPEYCAMFDLDFFRADGYGARTRGVPYEFQPGTTGMLVIRRCRCD